jgi:hypothetical protein
VKCAFDQEGLLNPGKVFHGPRHTPLFGKGLLEHGLFRHYAVRLDFIAPIDRRRQWREHGCDL